MIKVILVDDEPFLLQMLENTIPWEDYDMSVVGTFYNGRQALEYINENPVDVVISDIMMPVMDGMSLLQELKKVNSPVEFVVLSSYSDFELVRNFFRVGIFDYLTKIDIDSDQTKDVLTRLNQKVESQKASGKGQDTLSLLRNLLSESKMDDRQRMVVLSLSTADRNYLPEFNAFVSGMADNCGGRGYNTNNGDAVFLFPDQQASRDKIHEIESGMKMVPYRILGGLSTADYPGRLEVLFDESQKGVNYSFYVDCMVVPYMTIPARDKSVQALEPVALDMCKHYIKSNLNDASLDRITDKIMEVFDVYKKWNMSYPELKEGIKELLLYLNYLLKDRGVKSAVLEENYEHVFSAIDDMGDFNGLRGLIQEYLHSVNMNMQQDGTGALIERIRMYIDMNYDKDLSLKSIARHFGISASYLSRLFVKENNITFKRYVNTLKIEKAKEYLTGTTFRIGEICEKLGYNNVEHFSRLFREEVGFSPSEYRNIGK